MHGRKKSDLPQTKEEKDAVQAKISNYKKVSKTVLSSCRNPGVNFRPLLVVPLHVGSMIVVVELLLYHTRRPQEPLCLQSVLSCLSCLSV